MRGQNSVTTNNKQQTTTNTTDDHISPSGFFQNPRANKCMYRGTLLLIRLKLVVTCFMTRGRDSIRKVAGVDDYSEVIKTWCSQDPPIEDRKSSKELSHM